MPSLVLTCDLDVAVGLDGGRPRLVCNERQLAKESALLISNPVLGPFHVTNSAGSPWWPQATFC